MPDSNPLADLMSDRLANESTDNVNSANDAPAGGWWVGDRIVSGASESTGSAEDRARDRLLAILNLVGYNPNQLGRLGRSRGPAPRCSSERVRDLLR